MKSRFLLSGSLALALTGMAASGQTAPSAKKSVVTSPGSTALPSAPAPDGKAVIVEQIVARVNDKIITSVDLANAQAEMESSMADQAKSGTPVTPAERDAASKDLLRTLIDNQLLIQRAADLGMSAETDVVLQLDQLRQQNHLASMEDLQKAVESEGQNYEDFQQSIKNQILEKKVIEEDVAPRLQITPEEIAAYYNQHKTEFVSSDEVGLSEIVISTKGVTDAEKNRLTQEAAQVQDRAAKGEDFAKLAKLYSSDSSAQNGGDIGFEKKSDLDPALGKILFALPVNGVTPVQNIPDGLLIVKVTAIHHAGQETLDEAKAEIQYRLYTAKMQPEMAQYLAKLRSDAYITVKPGYVDTGADAKAGVDLERFQRVLPTDLPKPVDKDKSGNGFSAGGGGE